MEEWKDIKGYEGLYQISNYGRVKSLGNDRNRKEKILKNQSNNKKYEIINLCKNGKIKRYFIHRLVAEAFIPNPNNLPYINHKDENPSNNYVNNLEWCTIKYNNNYGTRNKRCSKKMKEKYSEGKHPCSKKVKCITTGEIFNSVSTASEIYNINRFHIADCCRGERKSAGKHPITGEKLVWEYVDE